MFTQEQLLKLKTFGLIAKQHLYENDKRVVNCFQEAFEILEVQLIGFVEEKNYILKHFKKTLGFGFPDAFNEFEIACYNTAQYERGLEICDLAEKFELIPQDDILSERAELYGHLGEFKKAEQILTQLLEKDPNDVWSYIKFGDLYYNSQVLPEKQDLRRAESFYYKAFDKGIGAETEDGLDLIERLGDVCVERLRRKAEKNLLELLEEYHIGRWLALEALKNNVNISGHDGVIFSHLQMEIFHKVKDHEKANIALQTLTNAYNLMPQEALDGLCPFQMAEYYRDGEHTSRIIAEKMLAYQKAVDKGSIPAPTGAEGAEAFSTFQENFMKGIDTVTGKQRTKVLDAEQKKVEKEIDSGEFLWMGFIKYRYIDDLSQLGNKN